MTVEVSCKKCKKILSAKKRSGKQSTSVVCDACSTSNKIALCPQCGSSHVYGISRVVGYYSKINNWNRSKTAEFVDRQKGDYKL